MIRAALRSIHSPDVLELDGYVPEGESFRLLVQAMIGPLGDEGAESFDFIVCSPAWVAEATAKDGVLFGKGLLIIESYHYATLEKTIVRLCQRTWGKTWQEVAIKLSGFGGWEFENYQP